MKVSERERESKSRGEWVHCGMYAIDSKASTSALEPSLVPHRCPVLLVTHRGMPPLDSRTRQHTLTISVDF